MNTHLPFVGGVVNAYRIDLFNCSSHGSVKLNCDQPKYIRPDFIFQVESVVPRPVGYCL